MLKYYIEGLAMLSGYASWVLLAVAIIYSLFLNRNSSKKVESDDYEYANHQKRR